MILNTEACQAKKYERVNLDKELSVNLITVMRALSVRYFEYSVPIQYVDVENGINKQVGTFDVYVDHEVVVERIKEGLILLAVNSFIKTAALWLIFLYFTQRIVARPLKDLTEAAHALNPRHSSKMSEAELLERMSISENKDELSVLSDSLMQMRGAVIEKIRIIENQNAPLEQRVSDRTASLVATNEQLTLEIQQRKDAEARLRIYREIIVSTDEAIFITNPAGEITEANPACERATGYSRKDLLAKSFIHLLAIEGRAEICESIERAVANGDGHWRGEVDGMRNDGSNLSLWIVVSAIYDERQKIDHLIYIYRDITELKDSESRASQAKKLESIGQLAAGVAHEINTPAQYVGDNIVFLKEAFAGLGEIESASQSLLIAAKTGPVTDADNSAVETIKQEVDSEFLSEEIPAAISQALEGIQKISKIVGAMKSFSHMRTDEKRVVDLRPAIDNAITISSHEWKYVAVIEKHFEENLPNVPCYIGELNQVVLNLIVNAAHAIQKSVDSNLGDKGKITVGGRHIGNAVEIRISDTGCGIPDDIRDRVFAPFFTTKDVGKGTGQGLSMAHQTIV
ncbi:MAG: PAS domain S-box protein, partial [Gammaproteobacteria bacterium]